MVWVLVTSAALRDDSGQVYEYVAAVTDIGAQKRAQEEVQRLNAELEERVRQTGSARRAWPASPVSRAPASGWTA